MQIESYKYIVKVIEVQGLLLRQKTQQVVRMIALETLSVVDKLKNRANCDKRMKLGEDTQFGMLNKIRI